MPKENRKKTLIAKKKRLDLKRNSRKTCEATTATPKEWKSWLPIGVWIKPSGGQQVRLPHAFWADSNQADKIMDKLGFIWIDQEIVDRIEKGCQVPSPYDLSC